MSKIKVYIASPYTIGDCAVNVRRQMICNDALISAGYAPYAPLIHSHFQHMMHPRPYDDWTSLDLDWVLGCDVVLRLSGESNGADGEVAFAKKHSIPVVYSIEELTKIPPGALDRNRMRDTAIQALEHAGFNFINGQWRRERDA